MFETKDFPPGKDLEGTLHRVQTASPGIGYALNAASLISFDLSMCVTESSPI